MVVGHQSDVHPQWSYGISTIFEHHNNTRNAANYNIYIYGTSVVYILGGPHSGVGENRPQKYKSALAKTAAAVTRTRGTHAEIMYVSVIIIPSYGCINKMLYQTSDGGWRRTSRVRQTDNDIIYVSDCFHI